MNNGAGWSYEGGRVTWPRDAFFCGKCHTLFPRTCSQLRGVEKNANIAWKV